MIEDDKRKNIILTNTFYGPWFVAQFGRFVRSTQTCGSKTTTLTCNDPLYATLESIQGFPVVKMSSIRFTARKVNVFEAFKNEPVLFNPEIPGYPPRTCVMRAFKKCKEIQNDACTIVIYRYSKLLLLSLWMNEPEKRPPPLISRLKQW